MEKDIHLVNIYLRIHNHETLTMDDLRYLAQYSPECFEITCKNVVYNIPEAKPIMTPTVTNPPVPVPLPETSEEQSIEKILANIKRLEADDFPIAEIDATQVKNLLGNLYMELLFPHNDRDTFFDTRSGGNKSLFDKRA